MKKDNNVNTWTRVNPKMIEIRVSMSVSEHGVTAGFSDWLKLTEVVAFINPHPLQQDSKFKRNKL